MKTESKDNMQLNRKETRKKTPKKVTKSAYIIGLFTLILVAVLAQLKLDIPVETLVAGYAGEESRFVQIDGMFVHYIDQGLGEPLVLIHGAASSSHTWDDWAEELKDQYRVIRMDLPGFGLTGPHPEDDHEYGLYYYAEFIDKFLGELGIQETYMAGNSLGGGVTWMYASLYPEKVKKIALLAPVGFASDGPWFLKMTGSSLIDFMVRHFTPEFAVNYLVRKVYGDNMEIEKELSQRHHHLLLRQGNRKALMSVLHSLRTLDYIANPENVLNVQAPTLILWGEEDNLLPVANAEKFKEIIPGSQSIIYPDVGHVIMEEISRESAAALRSFLEN